MGGSPRRLFEARRTCLGQRPGITPFFSGWASVQFLLACSLLSRKASRRHFRLLAAMLGNLATGDYRILAIGLPQVWSVDKGWRIPRLCHKRQDDHPGDNRANHFTDREETTYRLVNASAQVRPLRR